MLVENDRVEQQDDYVIGEVGEDWDQFADELDHIHRDGEQF